MVTTAFCVDVVSVPKVQGVRLVSLFRGSLVSVIPYECGIEGWGKVKLADGRFGYIREQFLENKEFSQAGGTRKSWRDIRSARSQRTR